MKHKTIYRLIAIFTLAVALFGACTEEVADVRLEPTLATSNTFDIKSDSATVVGFVVAEGEGIIEKGICYNTSGTPTLNDSKTVYSGGESTATFHVTLSGLDFATKYYARAYVISGDPEEEDDDRLIVYGEEVTFTTLPVVPFILTSAITEITGNSAKGGGEITGTGGADVTARGLVWSVEPLPTVDDDKTTDGEGTGAFESALTGLLGNTKYYVRAYASNNAGTGYGPEVSFTTLIDLPTVTTSPVTEVTKTSAVTGGKVTADGGDAITAYGVVWGMNPEPTTSDNVIDGGMDIDSFVVDVTGLEKYTTYYVRAFATNSAGTAYGENIEFTTLADILTWNLPGDYVEASYPGSELANWSPDKSPQVISTIENPASLEGYVYMANDNNQWKFATQPNWDGPNYGDDGSGNLDPNADNINSPKGFYKINADATALTYTAIAQVWGVIGSATPNGWDDETPLVYNPEIMKWTGGMHLTAADIKFRANHDWNYNYGSDEADGTLQAGGKDIPVDLEADYVIELDFSTPNAYTYSANRWGVIGDATPGGWSDDTNMTWDEASQVLTITLDLVVGNFKFRANDNWDLNYGGDLNNLNQGGSDIPIGEAGNYTITFDPWGLKATVTKN